MTVDSLPVLSGVLGSHIHYDHFDMAAFSRYRFKDVPFAVKTGMAETARKSGFKSVQELEPWQSTTLGAVQDYSDTGKARGA